MLGLGHLAYKIMIHKSAQSLAGNSKTVHIQPRISVYFPAKSGSGQLGDPFDPAQNIYIA